ncbi:hypothetical protein SEA_SWITZERLAND_89 [Gordonia phage Switzerland]|uniref:Uncharacterized protein n=1 Tax=Gordonia phage Soups TaxID=1838079 RepID=A0A160DG36_9CAUD|nr:hypothetical protein BEN61_gp021 [Gordonia phage Rosalind]YP_009269389.1 hypothetical protein BEN59_gp020 [Gordonia phage Soups]ASZ73965.1 hypothetical protein SEA_SHAYRA_89 [Gordonia phage ShayRa]QDM56265.1 hypothetical protein SEA_REMO_89 [Gordonia phage ReMo]QLF84961.1 hypothetical protein SEA_EPSOCAMISIO_89 [Gordonia phage Epsocamisio]UOK18141.1 hypothetical protein SEA_SWITZERLAND_89 [Gordonia phage Switzerland]ANA87026.1 hypothetical protein PBI_SOUPS_91 [Gordonia phage Soups]
MGVTGSIYRAKTDLDKAMGEIRRLQDLIKQLPLDENGLRQSIEDSAGAALDYAQEAREHL